MNTIRYRGSREIRRAAWRAYVYIPAVCLATGLLLSLQRFTVATVLAIGGFAFAVVMPVALWVYGRYLGSTTTDNRGIRTRATVVRRSSPWSDVASLEIFDIVSKGSHTFIIQVQRRHGRPIKLPGLIAERRSDPKLTSDLEAIRADWEAATGRVGAQM